MSIELGTESDYDVSRLKNLPLGCLLWVLGLLLVFGILVFIFFVYRSSGPPPLPDNAIGSPSASAAPAAGCEDATTAFRAAGGSELVSRVCWEPTGQLRAEASPPADIEPGSAPMRAVCTALSDFVTASGKEWKGFTVYSTHQFTPGRAMLTSSQQGQCGRP